MRCLERKDEGSVVGGWGVKFGKRFFCANGSTWLCNFGVVFYGSYMQWMDHTFSLSLFPRHIEFSCRHWDRGWGVKDIKKGVTLDPILQYRICYLGEFRAFVKQFPPFSRGARRKELRGKEEPENLIKILCLIFRKSQEVSNQYIHGFWNNPHFR